jgi:hypothetical protein
MGDENSLAVGFLIGFAVGVCLGWIVAHTFFTAIQPKPATYNSKPSTYNNFEEWEIIKDESGRVKNVKVHRKAQGD